MAISQPKIKPSEVEKVLGQKEKVAGLMQRHECESASQEQNYDLKTMAT
jgi:hypothetical protein